MNKIDGRYLKHLRQEHGYSLRELSEIIYVSKSSLQRWEQSFIPENHDVLKRISEIFNVTIEEMYSQSEIKYGDKDDNSLTQEQLAELKFGVKWLIFPITGLLVLGLSVTLIMILI